MLSLSPVTRQSRASRTQWDRCSISSTGLFQPRPAYRLLAPGTSQQRPGVVARQQGDQQADDDSIESMFAKELKRRGFQNEEGKEDKAADVLSANPTKIKDPFTEPSPSGVQPTSPFASSVSRSAPRGARAARAAAEGVEPEVEGGDQRQRTMALVNEGLEGLFPRASQLLQLGGSIFLGFLPIMALISGLFTVLYMGVGGDFVHGGNPDALPAYIDPDKLLAEPTVDPYIPF